jgi:hypothetical protein
MPNPSHPFPGPTRESTTNANGEFIIRYLPTTSAIENSAEKGYAFDVSLKTEAGTISCGMAFSEIDNQIAADRSAVEVPEERDGMLRGRVLDEATEKPIENFRVVRRFVPAMQEFTNAQGEFLLDQLKLNRFVQLFVYAQDYAPFVVKTTADDGGRFVECRLKRRPSIKGIVVDSSGKPVAGAEIVFGFSEQKNQSRGFYWGSFQSIVDGYMGLNFVQRLTTKDDGRFELGVVDQHPVIAIMATGFARQFRSFDASGVESLHQSELQIMLEPECVLEGFVKMNGVPATNASLRLSNIDNWDLDFGAIEANAEGRFSIRQLPAGNYHLSVYQDSGYASTARLTKKIVLHNNEQMRDVVLDSPGGSSSLRGEADPFAFVILTPKKLEGEVEIEYTSIGTVASPEGEFEIRGLHPGTYSFSARRPTSGYRGFSTPIDREVVVNGGSVLKASKN